MWCLNALSSVTNTLKINQIIKQHDIFLYKANILSKTGSECGNCKLGGGNIFKT
jgi:hypothetical protein